MRVVTKSVWTFAACALLLLPQAAQGDNFVIDNSHTSVIFGVSHLGYSYTYGRFNKVEGRFSLDQANPAASKFQLLIHAPSIDSNDPKRDEHLKGPDFFNVKQFPAITFESTGINVEMKGKDEYYNMTGKLTMHGVTREITLPVQKLGEGKGPYGKYRSGFLCQTKIKRSEYGMTNMIPNIGDSVAITISFEGIREEGAAAAKIAPVRQTAQAKPPIKR